MKEVNKGKSWDEYVIKYEKLAQEMKKAGIDPKLLDEVIKAAGRI